MPQPGRVRVLRGPRAGPAKVALGGGARSVDESLFPSSDGEPVADSPRNLERLVNTRSAALHAVRRLGLRAWVGADQIVYVNPERPDLKAAPDFFVALGCEPERPRPSFRYWEEPAPVGLAGEFLSVLRSEHLDSSATRERLNFFRDHMRSREVFLYEPLTVEGDDFLFRFLRARERDGSYEPVAPGAGGWYRSEVLRLDLRPHARGIEFRDPVTGEVFVAAEERAEREAARRVAAETELERLRRLLARRKTKRGSRGGRGRSA